MARLGWLRPGRGRVAPTVVVCRKGIGAHRLVDVFASVEDARAYVQQHGRPDAVGASVVIGDEPDRGPEPANDTGPTRAAAPAPRRR